MLEMTLAVQKAIEEGWVLQGGVSVCEVYSQVKYSQAMVKNS